MVVPVDTASSLPLKSKKAPPAGLSSRELQSIEDTPRLNLIKLRPKSPVWADTEIVLKPVRIIQTHVVMNVACIFNCLE